VQPEFVNPAGLYPGAPYDYAAVSPEGAKLVFAAGACPLNEAGDVVAPGDYAEQARVAIDNLRVALEAAGSGLDRVLKSTVYVASDDRSQLVRAWRVMEEAFSPTRPPSTLLGVAALGYEGQLVEIEAVALGLRGLGAKPAVPQGRAARPLDGVLSHPRTYGYEGSLRPCEGTTIAPLRRGVSRRAL
jgi:enamine deaminase RidA (YjgF/YER057c/UK114 family)